MPTCSNLICIMTCKLKVLYIVKLFDRSYAGMDLTFLKVNPGFFDTLWRLATGNHTNTQQSAICTMLIRHLSQHILCVTHPSSSVGAKQARPAHRRISFDPCMQSFASHPCQLLKCATSMMRSMRKSQLLLFGLSTRSEDSSC